MPRRAVGGPSSLRTGFTSGVKRGSVRSPCGSISKPRSLSHLRDCGTCGAPDGKKVESFTIITTEPNEVVEPIHNRMANGVLQSSVSLKTLSAD